MRSVEEILREEHEARMRQRGAALPEAPPGPAGQRYEPLTDAKRAHARQFAAKGVPQSRIARLIGTHQTTISRALRA